MWKKKYARLALIAVPVALLDQLTKAMVQRLVPLHHSVTVIPGYFEVTHLHNTGGAFGLFAGESGLLRTGLFVVLSCIALWVVFLFYRKTTPSHPWFAAGLSLVCGGALGNLLDRLLYGKVIDFLHFHAGPFHWPTFNVADSAVTTGVAILMLQFLLKKAPV